MIKLFVSLLGLLIHLGCYAQDASSLGQRLGQAFEQAAKVTGAIKDYGTPRKITKGAKPDLVVRDGRIYFNGKRLVLGDSMESWKKSIGPGSICGGDTLVTVCRWDAFGFEIGSGIKKLNRVEFINILFNQDPYQYQEKKETLFSGYFELEGYGIDRHTKFWEIRASLDRKHDLRCGVRDCSHPIGLLKGDVGIGMALTRNDEYGTLWELSLNLKND